MRLELSMKARLELQQRLAPQIIQSIEILHLPAQDLRELIEQELLENEVLEQVEAPREDNGANEETQSHEDLQETIERLQNLDQYDYSGRGVSEERDRKLEALQNTASRPQTLVDHLTAQLGELDLTPSVHDLTEYFICNLDQSGFLPQDPVDLATGADGTFTEEEIAEAVAVLQGLEPRGIGARNVAECLVLQLDPGQRDYYLLRELIEHHFEELSKNKLPRVAKATGQDIEKIKDMLSVIATMNPSPGRMFWDERATPINPDVVVEWVDGRYEVQVQDNYFPRLGISSGYKALLEQEKDNPKVHEYIRKKVESARWLIESIEQRKSTLFRVSREIVDRQSGFFDNGIHSLSPLKMQEVADALGIHVSTVSRAISDKWMQSPQGIHPLKFFFTGATDVSGGGVESRMSVKSRIKELVDNEDSRSPLSDEDIMKKLSTDLGLNIARRTVTKYRKQLGIASSRVRKQF